MIRVIFVLLAAALLLGLALYALRLWSQVWARRHARRDQSVAAQADQVESARILARALLDNELNLTEGAIRLKVVLDHLRGGEAAAADYPAIYVLYNATEHMPRRLDRRQRPAAEITRLDAEREALEARHGAAVREEARRLLASL